MPEFYNPQPAKATLCRTVAEIGLTLARYLGVPATPGMVLLESVYTDAPWVPVAYVARRACVSEDTARRRLDDLVEAGRALSRSADIGRGKVYRMEATWANRIAGYLAGMALTFREKVPREQLREQLENNTT